MKEPLVGCTNTTVDKGLHNDFVDITFDDGIKQNTLASCFYHYENFLKRNFLQLSWLYSGASFLVVGLQRKFSVCEGYYTL